ncbi:MAG: hypothetical protein LBL79_00310 [Prevotella sp.]|jgi:hypothetical protein|nr:hypothetical protein [Prevotella sp.]
MFTFGKNYKLEKYETEKLFYRACGDAVRGRGEPSPCMDFTFGPSDSKLGLLWDYPYSIVKSANNILTYTDDVDNISEAEKAEYKAKSH